jgi:ElaB/YqjD/DUF883 family membrane-anchored ribosome-binding protein
MKETTMIIKDLNEALDTTADKAKELTVQAGTKVEELAEKGASAVQAAVHKVSEVAAQVGQAASELVTQPK